MKTFDEAVDVVHLGISLDFKIWEQNFQSKFGHGFSDNVTGNDFLKKRILKIAKGLLGALRASKNEQEAVQILCNGTFFAMAIGAAIATEMEKATELNPKKEKQLYEN